jgi:ATP-grasp domain-containing protein
MFVVYICPFFSENAKDFLKILIRLPEIRLGVISQDPQEVLPFELRSGIHAHWKVNDCLSKDQILWAAQGLTRGSGQIHRILAPSEHIQEQVAQVRQDLGIEGMGPETARNFRDKDRMKEVWRAAGVPCARSKAAHNTKHAWDFVAEVGFPVCVKPIDGVATQSTFRVEDEETLAEVLSASQPSAERPLQIEEWVTGTEHSFETVSIGGEPVWHSLTHYLPTPLDAMRNPWVQYRVILPREVDHPRYDSIRSAGRAALKALNMETGLSHMEWFRREDDSVAIGEVAARPPGVGIMPLINRAHDIDFFTGWCRLMIHDQFDPPPERKYAAGCAFLRGLGAGRVTAVHGLEKVLYDLGDLVTDLRAPQIGEPKGLSYEGEGWLVVRHPETSEVESALQHVISNVRVELAHS